MPERDVGTAVYGEVIPDQPAAFQAQHRGWRESAQAGRPAGLGAERRAFASQPAHAGVPQHRWGAFLMTSTNSYMAAAAGLSVPPEKAHSFLLSVRLGGHGQSESPSEIHHCLCSGWDDQPHLGILSLSARMLIQIH